jgi:glycosyltransferase involved in cell wall biosynthesis
MLEKRFFPDIVHLVGSLEGVRLIVAGKKEGIFEEVKRSAERYDNVEFVGTISSNEILPRTHAADATFLLTCPPHKKMYHQETLFNKQFEAMVCGRPIIVTQGTYAGKMTEELNCGLTVEYNKESVKKAIITLRDNPELCEELGRNAFKAAKERYNWDVEKKKLLSVYEVIT